MISEQIFAKSFREVTKFCSRVRKWERPRNRVTESCAPRARLTETLLYVFSRDALKVKQFVTRRLRLSTEESLLRILCYDLAHTTGTMNRFNFKATLPATTILDRSSITSILNIVSSN